MENSFFKKVREPMNSYTHLIGAVLSAIGMIVLIIYSMQSSDSLELKLISVIVFGASLVLLYTASSVYHLLWANDKVLEFFRKIDHAMIFVLIAGSYTPICLVTLNGVVGYISLAVIWAVAIAGIVFKFLWMDAPRLLSTSIYIFMGWMCLFIMYPLVKAVPVSGMLWLFAGGVSYTVGGVIYGLKKPNWFKKVGFHEVFHIFVLIGSLLHFIFILNYVVI